jgi:hypothetical protein
MSAAKPLVYLILGATGSGRREVLEDLIGNGLEAEDRPLVLLSEAEPAAKADERLPALKRWQWRDGFMLLPEPNDASHIFLIADGRSNPVDQIEAFKGWLEGSGAELARVICVVDCQLAEKNSALFAWFEACAHFSDVMLFNKREGVANKWLSDFQGKFKDQFYPFLMESVKNGRVKNPALILMPEARRMSHLFDAEVNWVIAGTDIDADEEESSGDDEDVEVAPEEDPYLARLTGGRRVKELPNIAKYLAPA